MHYVVSEHKAPQTKYIQRVVNIFADAEAEYAYAEVLELVQEWCRRAVEQK